MTKRMYVDVHILQTVPPANLNRDDQGNPKEAYFGGVRRSRVSSQAWKRATRKTFEEEIPMDDLGTRTKKIAAELTRRLSARTVLDHEPAARLAGALLAQLGIKDGKKAGDTAYLLFYGHRQLEDAVDLIADQAAELSELPDEALAETVKDLRVKEVFQTGHPIDVALFGRMVADIPTLNVEAATQVAHAISTHATELEFDYYTAVDDQNEKGETGAGMIGTIGFNSATLYRYATVGVHQLHENLGETDKVLQALETFVKAFARSVPTGHGNSFAHRTLPSLVAVIVREDQPVNLVSAFENPITTSRDGIAAASAVRLAKEYSQATRLWGDTPAHAAICHTFDITSEDGIKLTEAFGEVLTFPALLAGLRGHLTENMKQS